MSQTEKVNDKSVTEMFHVKLQAIFKSGIDHEPKEYENVFFSFHTLHFQLVFCPSVATTAYIYGMYL